jgi:hypothetical protein
MSCYTPKKFVTFNKSGDIITLHAPDYSDVHDMDYRKVNIRNRANLLILFRPDYWPKSEIFNLTFSNLTNGIKDGLESFYYHYLGAMMTYTDIKDVSYSGFITSQEMAFEEENNCSWKANLIFEVV